VIIAHRFIGAGEYWARPWSGRLNLKLRQLGLLNRPFKDWYPFGLDPNTEVLRYSRLLADENAADL